MENTISRINKEVNVNAFYFNQRKDFKTFPKQIEFDGTSYTFIENGLRLIVQKGQQLVELFDMSDGRNTFRLRQEAGRWTLVGMKAVV